MSDCTWLDILVYKDDVKNVIDILDIPAGRDSWFKNNNIIRLFYVEISDAGYDLVEELSRTVDLIGYHGDVCDFGYGKFVGDNKYFAHIETTSVGDYPLVIDENRTPVQAYITEAIQFEQHCQAVIKRWSEQPIRQIPKKINIKGFGHDLV